MNTHGFLGTAALAVTLSGPAFASSITDEFTSFWVLGDSLSGFVGEVGGEDTARFSDGPLWSEQIVLDFEAAGKETDSFAQGGATAGLVRDDRLDLADQVDLLEAEEERFGDAPLVAITIGGNDIGAFAEGLDPLVSFQAFGTALTDLISVGVTDFLLFTVPDVGSSYLLSDLSPDGADDAARDASIGLNQLFFDVAVASLPDEINVSIIDAFSLTQTVYNDPGFFGAVTNVPCVIPGFEGGLPDCSLTTFWDPFHPTALVHDYIADEVREIYAPIPLPAAGWMLLAGIGGLAALRRRRG